MQHPSSPPPHILHFFLPISFSVLSPLACSPPTPIPIYHVPHPSVTTLVALFRNAFSIPHHNPHISTHQHQPPLAFFIPIGSHTPTRPFHLVQPHPPSLPFTPRLRARCTSLLYRAATSPTPLLSQIFTHFSPPKSLLPDSPKTAAHTLPVLRPTSDPHWHSCHGHAYIHSTCICLFFLVFLCAQKAFSSATERTEDMLLSGVVDLLVVLLLLVCPRHCGLRQHVLDDEFSQLAIC